MKLSFSERRKSTDRILGPILREMELFSLLRSVTPKTGTQIQTAKAENDIFMIMFYEHVTRCNKNNKSRPVGSWDFFFFPFFFLSGNFLTFVG